MIHKSRFFTRDKGRPRCDCAEHVATRAPSSSRPRRPYSTVAYAAVQARFPSGRVIRART